MAMSYIKPAAGMLKAAKDMLVPENIRAGVHIKGGGVDVVGTCAPLITGTPLVVGSANITNGVNEEGSGSLYPGAYNNAQYVRSSGHTLTHTFTFQGTVHGRLFFKGISGGSLSWGSVSSSGASISVGQVSAEKDFTGGISVSLKPNGGQYWTCFVFGIMA